MSKKLLDFSRLHHFIAFEEGAYVEDNQDPNALGHTAGSYLSALMAECHNPSLVLQSLRSLDRTISKLGHVVREGLVIAEKELLPDIYREGLYSLPFEIMERIFGLISDEGYVDFLPFTLVNRYFRDTVRRIPCLWTSVFDSKDPRIYLERSQSRGLFISMTSLSGSGSQFDRSLDALAPHWERWRSASFAVDSDKDVDDLEYPTIARLRRLYDEFHGRAFPALEALEVCYLPLAGGARAFNTEIRNFFSSWDMPALRCVSTVGFVPNLPPACGSNITRFQLRGGESSHVDSVGDALRVMRGLEEFSLEISGLSWYWGGQVKPVALPKLRVLNISTTHVHPHMITSLINALDVPSLREVKADLTVDVGGAQYACDLLGIFERSPFWTQLEILHCSVEIPLGFEYKFPASELVMPRLPPGLQHLTLEGQYLSPPTKSICYTFDDHALPLRSLRFRNCIRIDTAYVLDLGPVIFAPCFETLEIINCPNINADVLRTVMPKGKKLDCEEHNWDVELESFRNSSRWVGSDQGAENM